MGLPQIVIQGLQPQSLTDLESLMATICSEQVCVVGDARVNDRPVAGPRLSLKLSRFWSQPQPQPQSQVRLQAQSQLRPQSEVEAHPSGHAQSLMQDNAEVSSPRKSSGLRHLVQQFMHWMETRREQRENRDAFSHLLALDDTLLQDIGVTRAEVEKAARLPLAENAAQSLHNATRDRYMKRA